MRHDDCFGWDSIPLSQTQRKRTTMNYNMNQFCAPLTLALGALIATGCGGPSTDRVEITSADIAALTPGQTIAIDLEQPTQYVFDNEDGLMDFGRIELLFGGQTDAVSMSSWLDSVGDGLPNDPRDGGRFELDATTDPSGADIHDGVGQRHQGLRLAFCTRMRICGSFNGSRTCVSVTQCYTCRSGGDCTPLVPIVSVR